MVMKKLCINLGFILLTASVLGLSSCKKDKNDISAVTVQNISGTYKLTAYTFKEGNLPEENLLAMMDACEKDNPISFKSDGTYSIPDVGIVCTPPENFSSTWSLSNATTMVMNGETPYYKKLERNTAGLNDDGSECRRDRSNHVYPQQTITRINCKPGRLIMPSPFGC
jgi:hypothetical protein